MPELTGTTKFFDAEKRFGFIARDDGGKDVYCSWRQVSASGLNELKGGDRVSFELYESNDGRLSAINLKKLGSESATSKAEQCFKSPPRFGDIMNAG